MGKFFVSILILGLVFAGCAQKTIVSSSKDLNETSKEISGKTEEMVKTESKDSTAKTEGISDIKTEKIESLDIPTTVEKKSMGSATFEDIHFDFDSYGIREDARPVLKSIADHFVKNNAAMTLIEGHCDSRGTNEYNLALGERRAKSTMDYLVSLGVRKNRLDMTTYGEEKSLCREETEACWAKNRRAHFVIK